jgi:hypothetical protein
VSLSPVMRALFAAALAAFVLAILSTRLAGAEQTGGGGVVVSLNAEVTPNRLPRHRPVPVSVTISGSVRADDGGPPPRLRRLEFAFGARGGIDIAGLARCPSARLRNATSRQALGRCRSALIGHGTIDAEVPLNPEEPILAAAGVLAFNGRSEGRPAVWVHAYSASPPVSFVLPFTLRRLGHGAYGTAISSPVARALGRWPRLSSFSLTLGRRYRAGGIVHSYLRADCPLPPRFHFLAFPVARATYRFAPGPTHTITILRGCRVRS